MFKKSISYGIGLWICLTQAFSSPLQTVAVFIDDQVEKSQDSSSAIYARETLSASVSGKGFQVITHETVSKSLHKYSSDSEQVNIQASIKDNSIQTVAQQLGADYFLLLTLNHFSTEVKDLSRFDRKIYTHRLDRYRPEENRPWTTGRSSCWAGLATTTAAQTAGIGVRT